MVTIGKQHPLRGAFGRIFFYSGCGFCMKELDAINAGFVLMHKVAVIKMLLKQQNEREDGNKNCTDWNYGGESEFGRKTESASA